MAFIGNNPKVVSLNLQPQSADPANPREGDVYYSNGTPRAEGPWIYQNGAWAQFSTGAAITTVDDLTLTPQNADPGSPTEGMMFYSDGTSRAEGVWVYTNSNWVQITGLRYQEFSQKEPIVVRVATTANVTLASQLENGDTIDGVVLATGNLVLVKNQTTASENGVYVVAASGAPTRYSGADSVEELNNCVVYVTGYDSTTASASTKNKFYFQTATLTSLSDNQTWGTTAPTFSFTVPAGIYILHTEVTGGGGAGAGGAASDTGGCGGGAGALPHRASVPVTPGQVLTITIGMGGLGPYYSVTAANGASGEDSSIVGTGVNIVGKGGAGGSKSSSSTGGAGGVVSSIAGTVQAAGGAGGNSGAAGSSGTTSIYAAGGAGGSASGFGGSGGGGGAGLGAGAAGGTGSFSFSISTNSGSYAAASSGAGGGGAGHSNNGGTHGTGGHGGSGFVRISW